MPVIVPNEFPAIHELAGENLQIFTQKQSELLQQKGRPAPLRILFLNLMPVKQSYEIQMLRLLSPSPLPVQMIPVKMDSHKSSHGEEEHIQKFYRSYHHLKKEHFDGLIITGAPVEHLPFNEIDYWPELCEIMEWAKTNVTSSLFICWGALAGLFYHFGIEKIELGKKRIGAFEHRVLNKNVPLLRGTNDLILEPHTRETGCRTEDIRACQALDILAESPEAGPLLCIAHEGREIFMMGHPEYDPETVCKEYARDLGNGLDILEPTHLTLDNEGNANMMMKWRADGTVLYMNWLTRYAAKGTEWDFEAILGEEK